MPDLLRLLLPSWKDPTVHKALSSLAIGLGSFKAEDELHKASAVLPSVEAFIKATLPHCNECFLASQQSAHTIQDTLVSMCGLLSLAVKTFESAIEVTIRESAHRETASLAR